MEKILQTLKLNFVPKFKQWVEATERLPFNVSGLKKGHYHL